MHSLSFVLELPLLVSCNVDGMKTHFFPAISKSFFDPSFFPSVLRDDTIDNLVDFVSSNTDITVQYGFGSKEILWELIRWHGSDIPTEASTPGVSADIGT